MAALAQILQDWNFAEEEVETFPQYSLLEETVELHVPPVLMSDDPGQTVAEGTVTSL